MQNDHGQASTHVVTDQYALFYYHISLAANYRCTGSEMYGTTNDHYFEPVSSKRLAFAPIEDSDQPARTRRLI